MSGSVQSETTHRGRLLTVEVRSFTDEAGRPVRREIIHHPGAAVVVPVLDDGGIVLIRNRRIAVDETLWELPAGTLEPGEDPASAAARELEEETGYRAARVRPLARFYSSPGVLDEVLHAFIAEGLEYVGPRLDAGESIEAFALDLAEVLAMIADGRIRDGKTIAAVLLWRHQRDGAAAAAVGAAGEAGEPARGGEGPAP